MAYLLPLISGIIYGISGLVTKKFCTKGVSPILLSILYTVFGTLVTGIILIFTPQYVSISLPIIVAIVISGLAAAIGSWAYYKSLETLPVTIQSLLSRISPIIIVIAGVTLFNEKFGIYQILGILIVLLGMIFPGLKDIKQIVNKSSFIALLSGSLFALSALSDRYVSQFMSAGMCSLFGWLSMLFFLVLIALLSGQFRGKVDFDLKNSWGMIVTGITNSIAYYLILCSYSLGVGVGLSVFLSQIRIVILVVGGIIVFKEKNANVLKIVGAILVLIGVVLLKL